MKGPFGCPPFSGCLLERLQYITPSSQGVQPASTSLFLGHGTWRVWSCTTWRGGGEGHPGALWAVAATARGNSMHTPKTIPVMPQLIWGLGSSSSLWPEAWGYPSPQSADPSMSLWTSPSQLPRRTFKGLGRGSMPLQVPWMSLHVVRNSNLSEV